MKSPVLTLAAALCVALPAAAQVAYPANNQSPQTQAKDEAECSAWATSKTGFDPARPPAPPAAAQAPVTGSGARVRGAAAGAVIGGVAGGDVGDAALAGAAVGGIARRGANRRAARSQNEANAQQAGAARAAFDQARAACLSGRGYSVR